MAKKSNVGKNKVIRKVDKLQEVKFHGKDTGPESNRTFLHHKPIPLTLMDDSKFKNKINTGTGQDAKAIYPKKGAPSVEAINGETGEIREFPVKKGSLRKFNANLRKAESRAVSFVEGRSS